MEVGLLPRRERNLLHCRPQQYSFEIRFLDFATGATTGTNRDMSREELGLSVSPDGKTIIYSAESLEHGNDLVLLENFR